MGGWFSFGILFYVKVIIGLYLALKIFLPEHEIQNVINAGYLIRSWWGDFFLKKNNRRGAIIRDTRVRPTPELTKAYDFSYFQNPN